MQTTSLFTFIMIRYLICRRNIWSEIAEAALNSDDTVIINSSLEIERYSVLGTRKIQNGKK